MNFGVFSLPDTFSRMSRGLDPAPAAVVFTARPEREEAALRGYMRGDFSQVFITGFDAFCGTNIEKFLRDRKIPQTRSLDGIVVDLTARNTDIGARNAAAWAKTMGHQSIVVVTDEYHMRRSALLTRLHIPAARLYRVSVPMDVSWKLRASEFVKTVATHIGVGSLGNRQLPI